MPMHSLSGTKTAAPFYRCSDAAPKGSTAQLSVAPLPLLCRRICRRAESSRQFSLGQSPRSWHSVATQRPPVEVARLLRLAALIEWPAKKKRKTPHNPKPFFQPSSSHCGPKVQPQSSREPPAKQSQVRSVNLPKIKKKSIKKETKTP